MLPSTQTIQVASPTIHTTCALGFVNGRMIVIFPVLRSMMAGPSCVYGGAGARSSPNAALPSGAIETSTHVVESTDTGLRLGHAFEKATTAVGTGDVRDSGLAESCDIGEDVDCCSPVPTGEQLVRNTIARIARRGVTKLFHTVRREVRHESPRRTWSPRGSRG